MSLLAGVMRLFGADDDVNEGLMDYPAPETAQASGMAADAQSGIIEMPEPASTTLFVVRPEFDGGGQPAYSLKAYARYLLTRQALVLDINELAGDNVIEATRIVDYLSGVVEAVEGSVWEVTKNIFIFAPKGVKLAGDPLKPVEVH